MNENNLNNDDLMKDETPLLSSLKKEEPFLAPEGYFERFQSELQSKIHTAKAPWWKVVLKPIVWAPTMIALVIVSLFVFNNGTTIENIKSASKAKPVNLNNISFEQLDNYVSENLLAEANTEELIEMVGSENIPALGLVSENSEKNTEVTPTINHVQEEEMEEYILENIDEMEIY